VKAAAVEFTGSAAAAVPVWLATAYREILGYQRRDDFRKLFSKEGTNEK
jgi:hypothetical protein